MNLYVQTRGRRTLSMVMCNKCKIYWDAAEVKRCPICNLSLPSEFDEAQGEDNDQEETTGTTRAKETKDEETRDSETQEREKDQTTDTERGIQDKE
jgi:hypothetical protein